MRAEAEPFYREGGEAIGELLCRNPEREPEIWVLVAGTGIWKRWYLRAFAAWWRIEHPREYSAIKSLRHWRKRNNLRKADRLEASKREAANKAAMPTESQAPERPGGTQS